MSKTFDYLSGKTTGPLAVAEARAEYSEAMLESVLEENEHLRALNAEMVVVLEELLNLVRDTHEPWQCAWEHARAALAKAKEGK